MTLTEQDRPDQTLRAIIHACAAFFCFTAMQALGKLLVDTHGAIEIAFYRNLLAVLPMAGFILLAKRYDILRTSMPRLLLSRVLIGTAGLALTFAAMQALPMANATVIFFASTLMIPVFAHFFLKEHVGPYRWAAIGVGMCGVLLVAKPTPEMTLYGVLLALGAATVHASIQVMIRGMKNENPATITFYFFAGGCVILGLFMPWVGHLPTWETAPYLIGIGILGGLGQYFLTTGFQMAPASLLSPFNYTGLLWAVLFDVLIWGYIPGWTVYAGGAVIIVSKLYIIHRERLSERKIKT